MPILAFVYVVAPAAIVPAYVVEFTNPSWSYAIFITGDLSTLAAALGTSVLNLNVVVSCTIGKSWTS